MRRTPALVAALLTQLTQLIYVECEVLRALTAVREARLDAHQAASDLLSGGN